MLKRGPLNYCSDYGYHMSRTRTSDAAMTNLYARNTARRRKVERQAHLPIQTVRTEFTIGRQSGTIVTLFI